MKFTLRVRYALIGALVSLNFALRYPTIPHEIGADTFAINAQANTISTFGGATWIIHPFSYFGLTPASNPSSLPYLLSGLSQCANVDIEFTVLIVSTLIGLFGAFTMYLLAKEIRDDDLFAFAAAFAFSTSPLFLDFTIWTASPRNMFVALLPLFIWCLLKIRTGSGANWKFIAFSILLYIILQTSHRMALLLPPVVLVFLLSVAIYSSVGKIKWPKWFIIIVPILWIFTFLFFIYLQLLEWGVYGDIGILERYYTGFWFTGRASHIYLLNMAIDLLSKIGILLFLGIIGFGAMMFRSLRDFDKLPKKYEATKSLHYFFILGSILAYSPLIMEGVYIPFIILPFYSLIIAMGFIIIVEGWKKHHTKIKYVLKQSIFPISVSLILISVYFSVFMINHWRSEIREADTVPLWIDEHTYATAMYLKEIGYDNNFLCTGSATQSFIYGLSTRVFVHKFDPSKVKLRRGTLMDLYVGDTLYVPVPKKPTRGAGGGGSGSPWGMNADVAYEKLSMRVLVEDKRTGGEIHITYVETAPGYYEPVRKEPILLRTARECRYRLYSNDVIDIWSLVKPNLESLSPR
jgi:hypothetical protein